MKRIELHAKTKYSADYDSTIDIRNLILKAMSNKEKGIAIVDTNSVVSLPKAQKILKEIKKKDFKLIYGVQLDVSYRNFIYKVVVLLKNKKGVKPLFELMTKNNGIIPLNCLIKNKNNFILGLIYDEKDSEENILKYFDYIEVDNKVKSPEINRLKKKIMVIYSNRINALSDKEMLAKKVLYNRLNIKNEIDNRIYKSTEEILKELPDREIVIDNPNKIFNEIEDFELIDDKIIFPDAFGFNPELPVYMRLKEMYGSDIIEMSIVEKDIYMKLNEKYGTDVPRKIIKRVIKEIDLLKEYKYEGLLYIYKMITKKCKQLNEDYVICDYINYLYVAYLLGITHFDPIKYDLNYDIFFSNKPKICIKLSNNVRDEIDKYIKKDLDINTIRCKSLRGLNGINLEKIIQNYEIDNNINLSLDERVMIDKYLDDYPLHNQAMTLKEFILPLDFEILELTPYETICNLEKKSNNYTSIDYKDIEDKFTTFELLATNKLDKLNELKNITNDNLKNINYNDKKIINKKEFKDYLNNYKNFLVLDDLYEDLMNSNIELPDIFNIINEITKMGFVSKKSKHILNQNNIKLKKYHNINLINRGILNERTRIEYELLYFKEYYKLEYYYVMLKDCYFKELIDITSSGYKEVFKKQKDFFRYKYYYNYLTLIKELYESDVDFIIEEKIIENDFLFELDKKNNKIVLILNKVNSEINKYLSHDISLIGTRPINGKMPYISKLTNKLLNNNKSILLLGLNGSINYYVEYLLSEITKTDRKQIYQYLNPCSSYKFDINHMNIEEYINGIKCLLNSDLSIKDYHMINDSIIEGYKSLVDKIVYMIETSESDVVIIDCNSKELKTIIRKVKMLSKKNNKTIIIFTNIKRRYEGTKNIELSLFDNYKLLNNYVDNINVLDSDRLINIKENL